MHAAVRLRRQLTLVVMPHEVRKKPLITFSSALLGAFISVLLVIDASGVTQFVYPVAAALGILSVLLTNPYRGVALFLSAYDATRLRYGILFLGGAVVAALFFAEANYQSERRALVVAATLYLLAAVNCTGTKIDGSYK